MVGGLVSRAKEAAVEVDQLFRGILPEGWKPKRVKLSAKCAVSRERNESVMNDRRSLIEGLKQTPPVDPKLKKDFVYQAKGATGEGTANTLFNTRIYHTRLRSRALWISPVGALERKPILDRRDASRGCSQPRSQFVSTGAFISLPGQNEPSTNPTKRSEPTARKARGMQERGLLLVISLEITIEHY